MWLDEGHEQAHGVRRGTDRSPVVTALVTGAFLMLLLVASGWPAQAQTSEEEEPTEPSQEEVALTGVISVNQDPARPGTAVAFTPVGSETQCGTTTTTEGGNFSVTLGSPCTEEGAQVVATFPSVPGSRSRGEPITPDLVGVDGDDGADQEPLEVSFQLTDAELALLYPDLAERDDPVGEVLLQQATSVFEDLETMSFVLLAAAVVVLIVMVIGMSRVTAMRYNFADKVWENGLRDHINRLDPGDDISPLLEALKIEGESYQRRLGVFRWMVEGMVMSFVVVTVLALGAAGKISDEGIVSILAALVGYAAGRVSSSSS